MKNLKRSVAALALFVFGLSLAVPAMAAERGTKDEAKALVEKAVAFYKTNGKDKLVAEVNTPSGQFVDRDLYLIVAQLDGTRLAHGTNQKLIGKSLADMKDVDGTPYGQQIVDLAKGAGTGWVDYKFTDPTTKKIGQKTSYIVRADDIFVFGGAYK